MNQLAFSVLLLAAAPQESAPPQTSPPRLTLAEAPPVPELPKLVVEPLAFEFFAEPSELAAIPVAVRDWAAARKRELDRHAPPMEAPRAGTPWLRLYLASAVLDSGMEVWVDVLHLRELSQIGNAQACFLDPETGRLCKQTLVLETRLSGLKRRDLPKILGCADLDRDGSRELVAREQFHPGTDIWDVGLHWFAVDREGEPRRLLLTCESSHIAWDGLSGMFRSSVIPAATNQVWVQGWFDPRQGEALPLGHRIYRREGPGAPFSLVLEVWNQDAPKVLKGEFRPAGDSFASSGIVKLQGD